MHDAHTAEDRLFDRMIWRILPLITLTYFVSVIDKSNVGFAKLQMLDDLGMSEAAYGFASSLFFIAMLIFELPSSLIARRVGLRFWATRIMLTWAATTLLMMFTTTPAMFQALRFVLGVTEAGLYPAIIFYLACWFPQRHRARAVGFLTLGSAFGNGIGAIMSGPLLDLDGRMGLAGWQWLFLVTGLLPLAACAVVWSLLPNSIEDAAFLAPEDRRVMRAAVDRDTPPAVSSRHYLSVLWDPQVIWLSAVFIVILTALFGVIYWLPTVVNAFGVDGTTNGFLSAVPWVFVAVALLTVPPMLRDARQVTLAMCLIAVLGAILFALSIVVSENWQRFLCIALGTPCISLLITCFWTIPVRHFSGVHAAAAIAVISTYGNLGGFFAQNLMPWAAAVNGDPVGAMYVPATCLCLLAAGSMAVLLNNHRAHPAPRNR